MAMKIDTIISNKKYWTHLTPLLGTDECCGALREYFEL